MPPPSCPRAPRSPCHAQSMVLSYAYASWVSPRPLASLLSRCLVLVRSFVPSCILGALGGRGTWNYELEGNGIGKYVICTVEFWYQHRRGVGVYVYIIGSFSLVALNYLLIPMQPS